MTARCCQTEVIRRRIVFGTVGSIELECCECEAARAALKYSNVKDAGERTPVEVTRRRKRQP